MTLPDPTLPDRLDLHGGVLTVTPHLDGNGDVYWSWKCHACSTADSPYPDVTWATECGEDHYDDCPEAQAP